MTPEQARAAYEAMSPESKKLFQEYVAKVCDVITRADKEITNLGQRMADDVETWVNQEDA